MRPNENGTAGGSLLDEIVHDGARAMLTAALQAEVAACGSRCAGSVPHRRIERGQLSTHLLAQLIDEHARIHAAATPKLGTGIVEAIRALHTTGGAPSRPAPPR